MNLQNCVLSKSIFLHGVYFFGCFMMSTKIMGDTTDDHRIPPLHKFYTAFWYLWSDVLCLLMLGYRQCWLPRLSPVPWILEVDETYPLNIYGASTLRNFLLVSQSWGKDGVTPAIHPHHTCLATQVVLWKMVISAGKLKLSQIRKERKNIRALKNRVDCGLGRYSKKTI